MKSFKPFSNAVKTEVDGIVFASKAEAALYRHLKILFDRIYCQPKIYLTRAQILYKPDFYCEGSEEGSAYYEMKGRESVPWRLKRRLWKAYGPAPLHVYNMKNGRVVFFETIIPEVVDESCMPSKN